MNQRSVKVCLILSIMYSITVAQIQFPVEYPSMTHSKNTPNLAQQKSSVSHNSAQNPINYDSSEQHLISVMSRGFSQLLLDVNRIAHSISSEIQQADYVVFGPLTIAGALAIVMLASIGQTFSEVATCLGFSSEPAIYEHPIHFQQQLSTLFEKLEISTNQDIGQQIEFASAVFIQQDFPIRPAFQDFLNTYFKSNVMNLDFLGNPQNAKHVINTWVSGRTHRRISKLLDEAPPPDTTAIIASVLYFQASWQYPFYNGHTKLLPFYSNGRKNPRTEMVEMMSNGGEFPYYKNSRMGVQIMGFPYKGNQTTMYVIIPFDSNTEKLKNLENSLTPADLNDLVDNTKYTEAVVLFPKMTLESTVDLRNILQMMGVNSLFNPGRANLALLSPGVTQRLNEANEAPFVSPPVSTNKKQSPNTSTFIPQNLEEQLIFSRFNQQSNCIPVYDPATNITTCQASLSSSVHQVERKRRNVSYLRRGRNSHYSPAAELEKVRRQVIQNPVFANPGLYADQVIHKVFIDITESGTEAAAATGISLNRSGGRVTFRVDVPFLFFIYHEETKLILFWGSIKTPPSRANT